MAGLRRLMLPPQWQPRGGSRMGNLLWQAWRPHVANRSATACGNCVGWRNQLKLAERLRQNA